MSSISIRAIKDYFKYLFYLFFLCQSYLAVAQRFQREDVDVLRKRCRQPAESRSRRQRQRRQQRPEPMPRPPEERDGGRGRGRGEQQGGAGVHGLHAKATATQNVLYVEENREQWFSTLFMGGAGKGRKPILKTCKESRGPLYYVLLSRRPSKKIPMFNSFATQFLVTVPFENPCSQEYTSLSPK